jgi:hypothetical protein
MTFMEPQQHESVVSEPIWSALLVAYGISAIISAVIAFRPKAEPTFLVLSVVLLGFVLPTLRSGRIQAGIHIVPRQTKPITFWFGVLTYTAISITFYILGADLVGPKTG